MQKTSLLIQLAILGFIITTPAKLFGWTSQKLNDLALRDENNNIVVLGTEGSWDNRGDTRENVFDGDIATFFDPPTSATQSSRTWAGIELAEPRNVTRIRYCGRANHAIRMHEMIFEGANQADFSDATTLHIANPPDDWYGTTWIDVNITTPVAATKFKFLRIIDANLNINNALEGICCGNASEVEFYGPATENDAPPSDPEIILASCSNWRVNLKWRYSSSAMLYEIQRKYSYESEFKHIHTAAYHSSSTRSLIDPDLLHADATYRIRAANTAGTSAWVELLITSRNSAYGSWFGTAGSWNNQGMTGDKHYDGNIETYFDSPTDNENRPDAISALDLGQEQRITAVRYLQRETHASRIVGGMFEAADNPEFENLTLLHTITQQPPAHDFVEVPLPEPVTARYVRYRTPYSGRGNAAEIEFILETAPPPPPLVSITPSDLTNNYAVLTWGFGRSLASSGMVYRATSLGGPYTLLTPDGVPGTTWTDTTLEFGRPYYYKVAAVYCNDNDYLEGETTDYIPFRRGVRLERTWEDNTKLKSGVTLFATGTPYSSNNDAAKIFDGNRQSFADMIPDPTLIGVQFAEPCIITQLRFSPRPGTYRSRSEGATLFGSNHNTRAVELAKLSNATDYKYTAIPVTNYDAYQFVYLAKPGSDFYSNVAELELYGVPLSSLNNHLLAPDKVDFTPQANSLLLTWKALGSADYYKVERMPTDGTSGWSMLGNTTTPEWIDTTCTMDNQYLYRITAIQDMMTHAEEAISDTFKFTPYSPGNGTGLQGYYFTHYSKAYNPALTLAASRVDPKIDFHWYTDPILPGNNDSKDYVTIIWHGEITIPVSADYTFHLTTDDGVALAIDNQQLINNWRYDKDQNEVTIYLNAGTYPIRLDFYENTGSAYAFMEWSGPFEREIIPTSQLTPVALDFDAAAPWQHYSLNGNKLGYHTYNQRAKTYELHYGGLDFHGDSEGIYTMLQPYSNDFILEARIDMTDVRVDNVKAMLIVRNYAATGSPLIAPTVMRNLNNEYNHYGLKGRLQEGGKIIDMPSPAWSGELDNILWLRIKREGQTLTCFLREGDTGIWTPFFVHDNSSAETPLTSKVLVGFGVSGPKLNPDDNSLPRVIFSNLRLIKPFGTIMMIK